jgi:dihydroorotate dehydrogenase electron transfer subunit
MMLKKTFQIKAKLLYNKRIQGAFFRLVLAAPDIAKQTLPGQFISVRINQALEPLLRRPLSIHRVSGANIEILYEIVGKGTQLLAQKKAGEYLDVIGPLGSGFSLQLPVSISRPPILVAGGIGVAPLLFLAEKIAGGRGLVLIGAKDKGHILCEKEFKDLGCEVKIATDNGSRGLKGRVTELLKSTLAARKNIEKPDMCCPGHDTAIYACGPHPMLKEVAALAKKYNIPAQVSMEEHMACGIGACLGCVVKTGTDFTYKRVCKDGPVFKAKEIIW